jgi:hypothetical protein
LKAYYLIYQSEGVRDYRIVQAHSNEDAIQKADIHPKLIYHVSTLEAWEKFNEERKSWYR